MCPRAHTPITLKSQYSSPLNLYPCVSQSEALCDKAGGVEVGTGGGHGHWEEGEIPTAVED